MAVATIFLSVLMVTRYQLELYCKRLALVLLFCCCLPFAHANAQALLAIENSWPPYADYKGEGLSRDLVTEAFSAAGISTEFWVLPYARVLLEVTNNNVLGGLNVTRQSSTNQLFLFGQTPLLSASASFYFRKGDEYRYQHLSDLPDNFRVGLIIDYEYGDKFEAQRSRFNEVRVSNQHQLIKMLVKKRIDTAIMFDRVADYTMAKIPYTREEVRIGMPNHTSEIYVAFSPTNPESQRMADLLDQGLAIIKANGRYQQILANYQGH